MVCRSFLSGSRRGCYLQFLANPDSERIVVEGRQKGGVALTGVTVVFYLELEQELGLVGCNLRAFVIQTQASK